MFAVRTNIDWRNEIYSECVRVRNESRHFEKEIWNIINPNVWIL